MLIAGMPLFSMDVDLGNELIIAASDGNKIEVERLLKECPW